jgi:hypothetical protein
MGGYQTRASRYRAAERQLAQQYEQWREPARLYFTVFSQWDIVDAAIDDDVKHVDTLWTEFPRVALR